MSKVNAKISIIVSVLNAVFGDFWFLFVFLLVLNIVDYITGILKARYLKIESSKKAFIGFSKTLCTWVLIAISFGTSLSFVEIGTNLGQDFKFMMCIGWFMLAHCIVNEVRSILENIVQMDKGSLIPQWIIRGFEVAQNLVDKKANAIIDKVDKTEKEENYEQN